MRTWPALEITLPAAQARLATGGLPDDVGDEEGSGLVMAALADFDVSAVSEEGPRTWRAFFHASAERDRALLALPAQVMGLAARAVDVPDDDWAARSQASLRAVRVGRIVVSPPWDVPATSATDDGVVLVIQPSMGFGTGHHATTRLCLDALQQLPIGGASVLDVGSGSGVLALAARSLGAARVRGIDSDPDAVAAAQENVDLNVDLNGPREALLTFAVADIRQEASGPYDIVVANLTGGLILAVAELLAGQVRDGGWLVLSGIQTAERDAVLGAFPHWTRARATDEDGWCCAVLRPVSTPPSA